MKGLHALSQSICLQQRKLQLIFPGLNSVWQASSVAARVESRCHE